MVFPNIDPIFFRIAGPIVIRWYSLSYILGLLVCRYVAIRANRISKFTTEKKIDDCVAFGTIGLIIGARIAFALFYHPSYFAKHPLDILLLWEGGLSWHGGAIGLITMSYIYCVKNDINPAHILDPVAAAIPIVFFFGRIGNFINGELYGSVTSLPIGMIFPNDPTQLPRHPSQLYESVIEGLVLFIIMQAIIRNKKIRNTNYLTGAYFLFFYAFLRFITEFWREPDIQCGKAIWILNRGQVLCIIQAIIALKIIIVISTKKQGTYNKLKRWLNEKFIRAK